MIFYKRINGVENDRLDFLDLWLDYRLYKIQKSKYLQWIDYTSEACKYRKFKDTGVF